MDDTFNLSAPAVYVWLGKGASLAEKRLAVQYAQTYLHSRAEGGRGRFAANIVKMKEDRETDAFLHALGE